MAKKVVDGELSANAAAQKAGIKLDILNDLCKNEPDVLRLIREAGE